MNNGHIIVKSHVLTTCCLHINHLCDPSNKVSPSVKLGIMYLEKLQMEIRSWFWTQFQLSLLGSKIKMVCIIQYKVNRTWLWLWIEKNTPSAGQLQKTVSQFDGMNKNFKSFIISYIFQFITFHYFIFLYTIMPLYFYCVVWNKQGDMLPSLF